MSAAGTLSAPSTAAMSSSRSRATGAASSRSVVAELAMAGCRLVMAWAMMSAAAS